MKYLISFDDGLKRVHHLRGEQYLTCSSASGYKKGKALESSRLVYSISCSFCLSFFEGVGRAKYCSESCKQKAKRLRQKVKL
ncbi:hypothetical protein JCM14076_15890 [Methylosoma difficile]